MFLNSAVYIENELYRNGKIVVFRLLCSFNRAVWIKTWLVDINWILVFLSILSITFDTCVCPIFIEFPYHGFSCTCDLSLVFFIGHEHRCRVCLLQSDVPKSLAFLIVNQNILNFIRILLLLRIVIDHQIVDWSTVALTISKNRLHKCFIQRRGLSSSIHQYRSPATYQTRDVCHTRATNSNLFQLHFIFIWKAHFSYSQRYTMTPGRRISFELN